MIRFDFNVMQQSFSNKIVHPPLHNLCTGAKDWLLSPGIICPSLACIGICGQSNSHMCVDVRVDPSGIVTVRLVLSFLIFFVGAWI